MIEACLVKRIRVSDARAALDITQRDLAEKAGISHVAVRSAEQGQNIRRLTAHKILRALNEERRKHGLAPLDINDLELNISR